jgi:hypothetical protein
VSPFIHFLLVKICPAFFPSDHKVAFDFRKQKGKTQTTVTTIETRPYFIAE